MGIVKILLLTVLPAIVLGCIIGIIAGKHQVKKANNQVRRVLSNTQRIVYSVSILVGVACVITGFMYKPAGSAIDAGNMDEMGMGDYGEMGGFDDGVMIGDMGELPLDGMEEEIPMDGEDLDIDAPEDPNEEGDILQDGEDATDGEEFNEEELDAADTDEAAANPSTNTGGSNAVATPAPAPRARASSGVRIVGGGTGGSVTIVG